MARKAKPNSRTVLRYISPDDNAIGLAPDDGESKDFSAGWKKYNDTFDETHLNLKAEEVPSYYYIKPMTFDAQTKFFEAFADSDDTTSTFERAFSPGMRHVLLDFVERFVIGAEYHEEVTEVRPNGKFDTKVFRWEVGTPRPEGFVESVMADANLTFNLFMFAINASKLSETEKKL